MKPEPILLIFGVRHPSNTNV